MIVDLSGALGASSLAFIAPGVIYYALFPEASQRCARFAAAAIGCFGVVALGLGLALVFVELGGGIDSGDTHH